MTIPYRRYGSEIKEIITIKYQSNQSAISVSQELHIPYGTVHNWFGQLADGRSLLEQRRGGAHNVRITPQISAYIANSLDSINWLTMSDLSNRVFSEFAVRAARSTISNHVQNVLGYSYKIIRPVSDKRNCETTKDKREEFVEWIMAQDEDEVNKHFVFIDQSGFWMNKFKRRGYLFHNQTPQVITAPRGSKVNVCGVISGQGLVYLEAFTPQNRRDNFDAEKMIVFMRGLDRALKNYCDLNGVEYERIYLFLDNCSIHHSRVLTEAYWDECPFTVKYLPPWSPMLNPIEEVVYSHLVLGTNET